MFNKASHATFEVYDANAVISDFNATLLFIVNNESSHDTIVYYDVNDVMSDVNATLVCIANNKP